MSIMMISPNELQNAAKKEYLEGKNPTTPREWSLCVNYWAANISEEYVETCCLIMAKLYECPLDEVIIKEIVAFQLARK